VREISGLVLAMILCGVRFRLLNFSSRTHEVACPASEASVLGTDEIRTAEGNSHPMRALEFRKCVNKARKII